jgi:3-isopropylmalate dehydrogenase
VTTYRITLLPGDGVGREIVPEAVRALEAVGKRRGRRFEFREALVGGAAIDRFGVPLPDETLKAALDADAVLLGAVGGPKWEGLEYAKRPERALLGLRERLGTFANLRPAVLFPMLADASSLKPEVIDGLDIMVVRELTGGIYFGRPSEERTTADGRVAVDTLLYTEAEIARVVRLAFELAAGRRSHLTSVDKANVLASSRLWRKVVDEVRPEFPAVEVSHQLVDSCAMLLVRRPAAFDVLVTENLFGDILSDEAAVLVGSLGMLPSASLGERRTEHGRFGLYEPIHGSAPDIAGRDLANPIGTILSAAMMLRWSLGRPDAAEAIEAAVSAALDDGWRTADIAPEAGTPEATGTRRAGSREMAAAIVGRLPSPAGVGS